MSRLFPKPRLTYKAQYEQHCSDSNIKFVMGFSVLAIIVFGFHLAHHFRLGWQAVSPEMMPFTLIYLFSIGYPALNVLVLYQRKSLPALLPVARFFEFLFPFFMATVAVLLSVLSAQANLGITPFAIIMMVVCFTLQGQFVLLLCVLALASWLLCGALIMTTEPEIYSPLVAISFTTAITGVVIANITEHWRIRQFEIMTALNSKNRQLQLLSQQDHLTGLLNRRAVDQVLVKELTRAERFDHTLSLLVIDLDNFKQINDGFGHVFGDQVLKDVATSINKHIRDVDYGGRIGGDEFVVILVETDQPSAMQVADRIRKEVHALDNQYQQCVITISIGHAISEGESHVALIEKADKALYLAKKAGKNKVRSFSSGGAKSAEDSAK